MMNSMEYGGTSLYWRGVNPAMFAAVKLLPADNGPQMEKSLVFPRLDGQSKVGPLLPNLREEFRNE